MRHSSLALHGVRLLIFDADDTLRRTIIPGQPCPRTAGEWELLPGVREALSQIDWDSIRLGIASNQDQVGYGLFSADTARRLLVDMVHDAIEGRARDSLIRFCPHRLEETCECRKPAPGMLLDLLRAAQLPAAAAVFVGNSAVDEQAALRAGVRFEWATAVFGSTRRRP